MKRLHQNNDWGVLATHPIKARVPCECQGIMRRVKNSFPNVQSVPNKQTSHEY